MGNTLKPGCHFFPGRDGKWYVIDGDERAAGASIPAAVAYRFLQSDEPTAGAQSDPLSQLTVLLDQRGVLHASSPACDSPAAQMPTVFVRGSGPVVDAMTRAIGEAPTAARIESFTAPTDLAGRLNLNESCGLMVSVDAYQRDEEYLAIDALARRLRIPWVRCCREGNVVSISPVATQPGHATYHDLRSRRLAASPLGTVLADLWRDLDGQPHSPLDVPPGAAQVVGGLLTEIVTRVLRGDSTGLPSNQEICLHLEDLTVTRHPVLPIPSDILDLAHETGTG